MSQNYNIEYTMVEEGEQILEFELPTSKSDCTLIIDDPQIISFVGSQNTLGNIQNDTILGHKKEYLEILILIPVCNTENIQNNLINEFVVVSPRSETVTNCTKTIPAEINLCVELLSDSTNNELIPTIKRRRNPDNWRVNQRKKKYQAGLEFVNNKGQVRPKKKLKNLKNCLSGCKQHCATLISESERKTIFDDFYNLNQSGKYNFITMTTERTNTKRKCRSNTISRRKFSFFYFFNINGNRIPVCKQFYLGTLAISQKPVYTVYQKMKMTGTVSESKKGTNNSKAMDSARVDLIINHIESFPCVDSHYCREKTSKTYLDANLNICKMYDLYSKQCKEFNILPVKSSYYRYIFNTRFNLDFFKPKSDRCGVCELFEIDKTRIQDQNYTEHISLKMSMGKLKDSDKQNKVPILCFDMEKVITYPKSNIDESFYLSKLNIYNLTAHLSTTKKVFCAIWNEATMERTGNDIESALYQILERVFDENEITNLITWSDSCVPQNKNSFMAYAIQHFMSTHPNIESIEMRYSLPGHSCIQEIDNAHSQIEKVLSKNEFFSPIGLIRLLKTINRNRPYQILQMKPTDFLNFDIPSAQKISTINLLYSPENYKEVSIRPPTKAIRNFGRPQKTAGIVALSNPTISVNKKSIP